MIKIDITSVVSQNIKAYTIQVSDTKIELGSILIFRSNEYKVSSIDEKYGINAFKILANSVSKSKYIHIDKDLTVLTEMTKKLKNYECFECFECKSIIAKGQEYKRESRFENPLDKSRLFNPIQKPICMNCFLENKFSFIDEKYNKPDIVKFGMYSGREWIKVPDDYLLFLYEKQKNHQYRNEIELEYNSRLLKSNSNEINPVADIEADKYIKSLHNKLFDTPKLKNTPQLTDTMRIVYVTLLKNEDKIKRLKHDYNSYYWLFEKSTNVKINSYSTQIDNRTVTALYERGLLMPIKFQDDIKKRKTEVIEYEAIQDSRVLLNKWGN